MFIGFIQEAVEAGKYSENMYDLLVSNLNLHEGYNVEVTSLWFALCLKLKKPDSIKYIREFLGQHGRMKYLKQSLKYSAFAL